MARWYPRDGWAPQGEAPRTDLVDFVDEDDQKAPVIEKD